MKTALVSTLSVQSRLLLVALLAGWSSLAGATSFFQSNLVSDIPGLAANTDPNLRNPWGIASLPTSPFWVSDNRTGVSTLYNGSGVPQALIVTVPPPLGGASPSGPTGVVSNTTTDFQVTPGAPARFIFATTEGTISAWNPASSATQAILKAQPPNAAYTGLAMGNNGTANFLYAANFRSGTIDVFNGAFAAATLTGAFTDPTLPAGYAPYNIQNLNGSLYVAYAPVDPVTHRAAPGLGNGVVDVFDTNGVFVKRLATNGTLDDPWGLAIAPADFGEFSNDLLVGNFGNGRINVFDPTTSAFLGQLHDRSGAPITIEGLWGLRVGNAGPGFDPNKVYFTAGISGGGALEDHGLFGSLAVPEPGTLALLAAAMAGMIGVGRRRR